MPPPMMRRTRFSPRIKSPQDCRTEVAGPHLKPYRREKEPTGRETVTKWCRTRTTRALSCHILEYAMRSRYQLSGGDRADCLCQVCTFTAANAGSLGGVGALAMAMASGPAGADALNECFSDGARHRIDACSDLIAMPGLDDGAKSLRLFHAGARLFAQRPVRSGAARLRHGHQPRSSLRHGPQQPWLGEVQAQPARRGSGRRRAVAGACCPEAPHAHDTRAHVRQARGEQARALSDYEQAIRFGGTDLIKLYQCGLSAHGLYSGAIDGHYTRVVRKALEICVGDLTCDPCRHPRNARSSRRDDRGRGDGARTRIGRTNAPGISNFIVGNNPWKEP